MMLWRASLLGGLAGLAFATTWWCAAHGYGIHTGAESAIIASIVFVTLAPLFDRIALRVGGDMGPRVFWSAIAWTTPLMGLLVKGQAYSVLYSVSLPVMVVVGALAAAVGVGARSVGIRSVTLRMVTPWLAILTLFVGIVAAAPKHERVPVVLPVLGLVGLAIAVHGLLRRGSALAELCDLDGEWLHAAMSVDGTVTVDDFPPMHAPEGIRHIAGPVLVRLSTEKAATFRATGAPTILRLVQGMDVDIAGRRAILDEGAKAYATAAALLPAATLLATLTAY